VVEKKKDKEAHLTDFVFISQKSELGFAILKRSQYTPMAIFLKLFSGLTEKEHIYYPRTTRVGISLYQSQKRYLYGGGGVGVI
jgi:hypothetical protein